MKLSVWDCDMCSYIPDYETIRNGIVTSMLWPIYLQSSLYMSLGWLQGYF